VVASERVRKGGFLGLVAPILALGACSAPPANAPPPQPTLETVEVGSARDAKASLAEERVERRRAEAGVAGVLPEGFPADVPLLRPASLIDFASEPDGRLSITLGTKTSCSVSDETYRRLLASAGWTPAGGAGRFHLGGRELAVAFEDAHPGCHIRLTARSR